MRDAEVRENLWLKYKDEPHLLMFDVYIKEAHPDMNPINPGQQPTKFEERLALYEYYVKDKKMTLPGLVDSMDNKMKGEFWESRATSCYLIGIDGKIKYVINFITQPSSYPQIDTEVKKALDEIQTGLLPDNKLIKKIPLKQLYYSNGKLSTIIPDEGKHRFDVITSNGRYVISHTGYGARTYTIFESIASGLYLIRISTDKQTLIKPVIIGK